VFVLLKPDDDLKRDDDRSTRNEKTLLIFPRSVSLAAADAVVFQRLLVILAERIAFPVLRTEDSPEVRMADKPHT
jgi:hypothetical protein